MKYILFSGHMIDASDRKEPRLPSYKETAVAEEISRRLTCIKENCRSITGIAGGACGGDIIFHEQCIKLGIPSKIYLPEPANEFKENSVLFAGKVWENRFDILLNELPVHFLKNDFSSPKDIWQQTNDWMLREALKNGTDDLIFLALWDMQPGKPGGTAEMIEIAKSTGITVEIINLSGLQVE